jgi:hypothetical protein
MAAVIWRGEEISHINAPVPTRGSLEVETF